MLEAGTFYRENQSCLFRVWAPLCKQMVLHLVSPEDKEIEMTPQAGGYFVADIPNLPVSTLYYYRPDNQQDYPDPASHFQPEGVHRPSKVVNHHSFSWTDQAWRGIPAESLVIYELHVGTFTQEGTFEAIIPRLQDLKELGITALQLMPVAQFPGNRNWGYDGAYPYAVQDSYGGPEGLKKLVDGAHANGMAVILDVVYNHLGPEGNYFHAFGPYFSETYKTPWGKAVNFDEAYSDGVRDYFANNAVFWSRYYHIDGLRLDAIHEIFDRGAVHFWEYVGQKLRRESMRTGRKCWLIAESDLNDPKVIRSNDTGGFGFDAQWLDDFHHALYVLIHEGGKERYADFGAIHQLQKAYEAGYVHSGEFVKARQRKFGKSSAGISGEHFIVFNQNHDQIGNRIYGERLSMLVDFDALKIAAGALLVSPYIPMLFMGEEYGDETPFYYFVSHSDEELIKMVCKGRKEEFSAFGNCDDAPEPHDISTFKKSVIAWDIARKGKHKILRDWFKKLLRLRKTHPALQSLNKNHIWCNVAGQNGLALYRRSEGEQHLLLALFNFGPETVKYTLPAGTKWGMLLNSDDPCWQADFNGAEPATAADDVKKTVSVKPLQFIILEQQNQDITN